jgi:hypothetical protein
VNTHYSNCEHTLRLLLDLAREKKGYSLVQVDWLPIVSQCQPCIDCLAFLDQKAQGHDLRLWTDELNKRLHYIIEQRSYKK